MQHYLKLVLRPRRRTLHTNAQWIFGRVDKHAPLPVASLLRQSWMLDMQNSVRAVLHRETLLFSKSWACIKLIKYIQSVMLFVMHRQIFRWLGLERDLSLLCYASIIRNAALRKSHTGGFCWLCSLRSSSFLHSMLVSFLDLSAMHYIHSRVF